MIIDEASMVGTRMAQHLLSFGMPILALGDEAGDCRRWPGDGGFYADREPDFQLGRNSPPGGRLGEH